MADNNENFSLTHEDHRRIFEELKTQNFSERKTSKNPRAIILCGQHGSDRSSQIPRIMQEFSSDGAVLIDESQIQGHTKSLFDEIIQRRFNIVIKDTLPNSEMLKSLRENGYSTSVYVISAHERESILSLYEKYEAQIEARGIGDKPKISEHDEIYKVLPSTLQKIEDEKLSDELLIIGRDERINYRNELKNNEWTITTKSSQALEESRNRAWTAEEISKYQ
ncbi:MAG: zeta toxin family protein [Synergistaceae bacterium]|nr:zeta toxin family protein [Synergistaceae bacterium]